MTMQRLKHLLKIEEEELTSADVLFPGDEPLTDDEIRELGWEPGADGWRWIEK